MRYNLRSRGGVPGSPSLTPSGTGAGADPSKCYALTARRRRRSPYPRPSAGTQTADAEPSQSHSLRSPSNEKPSTIRLWWPLVGAAPSEDHQPSTPGSTSCPPSMKPSTGSCAASPRQSSAIPSEQTAAELITVSGKPHAAKEASSEATPRSVGLSGVPARATDEGALPQEAPDFSPAPECPSETPQVKTRDVTALAGKAPKYGSQQSGRLLADRCPGTMRASPITKSPARLVLPSPATTPSFTQCRKRRRISIDPSSGLPANGTPGTAKSNADVPFLSSSSTRTTSATSPPSTDLRSDPSPRRSRPSPPPFPSPNDLACHVMPNYNPSLASRSSFVGTRSRAGPRLPDATAGPAPSPAGVQAGGPQNRQPADWLRATSGTRARVAASHVSPCAPSQCGCSEQTAREEMVSREPPPPRFFSRCSDESSTAWACPASESNVSKAEGRTKKCQQDRIQETHQSPSSMGRGPENSSDPSPGAERAECKAHRVAPSRCPDAAAPGTLRGATPLEFRQQARPVPLSEGQRVPCRQPCDRPVPDYTATPGEPHVSLRRPTSELDAPRSTARNPRLEGSVPPQNASQEQTHFVSKSAPATSNTGTTPPSTDGNPSKSARRCRTNTHENLSPRQPALGNLHSPSDECELVETPGQDSSPVRSSAQSASSSHASSLLFSELPPALLCTILRFLPTASVTAFGATCRYAYALSRLPASWSYLEDSTVGNIFRLENEASNGRKTHSKTKGLRSLTERFTGVTKLAIDLTSVISSSRRPCHQSHPEPSSAALLSPALLRLHTTRLASGESSGTVTERPRNDGIRPRPAFRRSAAEEPQAGDDVAESHEGVRTEGDAFILFHGLLGNRRLQADRQQGRLLRSEHVPESLVEPPAQLQSRREQFAELELLTSQSAATEASEQRMHRDPPRASGGLSYAPEMPATGDVPELRQAGGREGAVQDETEARSNTEEHLSNLRRALRELRGEAPHPSFHVVTARPRMLGAQAIHGEVTDRTGEFRATWIQRELERPREATSGHSVLSEASQLADTHQNSRSPDQLLAAGQDEAMIADAEQSTRLPLTAQQSATHVECPHAETRARRTVNPSPESGIFQGPVQHTQGRVSARGSHESRRLPASHLSAIPLLVLVPAAFAENAPGEGGEQRAREDQVPERGRERQREQGEDRERRLITVPGRAASGSVSSESEPHPSTDRVRTERQQLVLLHQLLMHLQQQRREQQRDERRQRPFCTLWGATAGPDAALHLQTLRAQAHTGTHPDELRETGLGRPSGLTGQREEAAESRDTRCRRWQQEEGQNDGSPRTVVLGPAARDSLANTEWLLSPDEAARGYGSRGQQSTGSLAGQPWPVAVEGTTQSAQEASPPATGNDSTGATQQGVVVPTRPEEPTQGTRLREEPRLPSSSNADEREVTAYGQSSLVAGEGGPGPALLERVGEIVHPSHFASIQLTQRESPAPRDREGLTLGATLLGQELFGEGLRQQRDGSQRRQLLLLPLLFASHFPLAFARQGEELAVVTRDGEDVSVHPTEARPRGRSLSQRQQQSSPLLGRRGGAFSRLLVGTRPTVSIPTRAAANAVKPSLLRALFGGLHQLVQLTLKLEAREAIQLPQLSLQLDLVKALLQQNSDTLRVIKVSVELPVDTDVGRACLLPS